MADGFDVQYAGFSKALGERIKKLRLERGLSLRDMVIKHDYHDSHWRRVERGGSLNMQSLLRVAQAFQISLSLLLDGLGDYSVSSSKQADPKRTAAKQIPIKTKKKPV